MLKLNHKKMGVWKESLEFTKLIYSATSQFPKTEQYGLANQMRRAVVSVPSNISWGAARFSRKERIRFFEIARSSLVELDTQLEISIELNYLHDSLKDKIEKQVNVIFAMLSNLIVNTK